MEQQNKIALQTAVNFLQNPKVVRSTLAQKRKFLKTKGLTDDEIQIACERAGIFVTPQTILETTQDLEMQPVFSNKISRFEKIKDFLSSIALISGITYAIFIFYKRFIEPLLFSQKRKKDQQNDIATKAINVEMAKIHEDIIEKQKQLHEENLKSINQTMLSFKTEIETIKGILLNRKQFASPPTIPSWQLAAAKQTDNDNKSDDTGSAHSNCSENDHDVTKRSQNSDSSLEIM